MRSIRHLGKPVNYFIITTHADHNPLIVALRENGVDVRRLVWGQQLPDLAGCLAFYGNLFGEIKDWFGLVKLKRQLQQNNVPYVFWNRDAPWNTGVKRINRCALQWIKPVDIYLTHSLQNCSWFGDETHYFPNAAQPAYMKNTDLVMLRNETSYEYDVSFYGSFSNAKDRNARVRQQFLTLLEQRLRQDCPGVRFRAIDTTRQSLSIDEQLDLIRHTKINLNYGAMCDLPDNPSWGLPERVFGIPAAGGYLLTDRRRHLDDTFPDNLCDTFFTMDDCVNLIQGRLSDFNGLRQCAEKMHAHILDQHTYRRRASTLVGLLTERLQRRG